MPDIEYCMCCGVHVSKIMDVHGVEAHLYKMHRPVVLQYGDVKLSKMFKNRHAIEEYKQRMMYLKPSFECPKCMMLDNNKYHALRKLNDRQSLMGEY